MQEELVKQVSSPTLQHAVYTQLRELIVTGKLKPGTRLKEQWLSEQLGVSRSPIREAIVQLSRDGLVTMKARNGDFVTDYTPQDVREIYDVRLAIEQMAVRRGMSIATDETVKRLEEAAANGSNALRAQDIPRYAEMDQLFHFELVDAANNQRLSNLMRQMAAQIQAVRAFVALDIERVRQADEEHRQIITAYREGRVDDALDWVNRHIESVRDEVVAMLDSYESETFVDD